MKTFMFLLVLCAYSTTSIAQVANNSIQNDSGGAWIVILALIGLILMCLIAAVVAHFFINPRKTVTDWYVYFLRKLEYGLKKLGDVLGAITKPLLALAAVYSVVFFPLRWGQVHLNTTLYNTLITLSCIYFFTVLWYISRKEFFKQFNKKGIGIILPIMIITGLLFTGVICFAAVTGAMSDAHIVALNPALPPKDFSPLEDFYLWHFCKLIPQIDVTETFHWENYYSYTDKGVAWLVFFFKALMAYIILERFYHWNKWRKETDSSLDTKENLKVIIAPKSETVKRSTENE
jgi:MFS family permease